MLSNSDPKNENSSDHFFEVAYKDFLGVPPPKKRAGSGCFGVRFAPVLHFVSHRPSGALRIPNAKPFIQKKAT